MAQAQLHGAPAVFPFLFGGTFIEAKVRRHSDAVRQDFPSFSEGLSLRLRVSCETMIEAPFPFLFGGTFIEAAHLFGTAAEHQHFPSFSEGLSLRPTCMSALSESSSIISLPFRRDFH